MSLAHTTAALQIRSLEPTSKLLLLVLCLGADQHGAGTAAPSTLAWQTGLAERTVRAHMATLVRAGFLERQRYETRYQLTPRILDHLSRAA